MSIGQQHFMLPLPRYTDDAVRPSAQTKLRLLSRTAFARSVCDWACLCSGYREFDLSGEERAGGQWWAMRHGSNGSNGSCGNGVSVTYRFYNRIEGPNPSLSANNPLKNSLRRTSRRTKLFSPPTGLSSRSAVAMSSEIHYRGPHFRSRIPPAKNRQTAVQPNPDRVDRTW